MKVTAKVYMPTKDMGNLKAFASLTIEEKIVITGLKLVSGKNGMFLNFPQYKSGDEYKDIAFPLTKELREKLTKLVVTEYNKVKDENPPADNGTDL